MNRTLLITIFSMIININAEQPVIGQYNQKTITIGITDD